jgi:hypothetical protein
MAANQLMIEGDRFLMNGKPFEMWGVRVASGSQTEEFTDGLIASLDDYMAHGVNTITLFVQGSSGGFSDPFSPEVDVLLFDTYGKDIQNDQDSGWHYDYFLKNGVVGKPMVNVEIFGAWTKKFVTESGKAGRYPPAGRRTHFREVDAARQRPGLSVFLHSNPWFQGPSIGWPVRYDLGGAGTNDDPGIRWYFEYARDGMKRQGGKQTAPSVDILTENDDDLVIEAEHYASKSKSSYDSYENTHYWEMEKEIEDYSGEGYMTALPDEWPETQKRGISSPRDNSGAEMTYSLDVSIPGRYLVFVRGYSMGGESNGVHIGLDGEMAHTEAGASNISGFRPHNRWIWESKRKEGFAQPATLALKAGRHTLNVWNRDDGFRLDKIVLRKMGSKTLMPSDDTPEVIGQGNRPDLAVDGQGNLHVVYARDQVLYYKKWDVENHAWSDEENTGLTKDGNELFVNRSDSDIVVDSGARPHVFAWRSYGFKQGDSWKQVNLIGSESLDYRDTELVIDSKDTLYLIKRGGFNGGFIGLQKLTAIGKQWKACTDPDKGYKGENDHVYADIAISPLDDSIHIINRHYGKTHNTGYHRSNDGGNSWGDHTSLWEQDEESPHITVDPSGVVYATDGRGFARRYVEGVWQKAVRVVEGGERFEPELSTDAKGAVYVATFGFKYNVCFDGEWGTQKSLSPVTGARIGYVETYGVGNGAYAVWEEGSDVVAVDTVRTKPVPAYIVVGRITPDGTVRGLKGK